MLQIQRLRKSFSGRTVIDDISCQFDAGEIHCIIGSNGSGKTVFSKILAGVYSRDFGSIRINTCEYLVFSPKDALRQGVSYVPQISYLPEAWAIKDILTASNVKITNDQPTLMSNNLDKLVGDFNVVERQIIELEIALSRFPSLLIVDEPLFFSQPNYLYVFERLKKYCVERGIIVLIITHDLNNAVQKADTLTLFNDSKVEYQIDLRNVESRDITLQSIYLKFGINSHGQSGIQSTETTVDKFEESSAKNLYEYGFKPGMLIAVYYGEAVMEMTDLDTLIKKIRDVNKNSFSISVANGHLNNRGLALGCSLQDNLLMASPSISSWVTIINRSAQNWIDEQLSAFNVIPTNRLELMKNLSGGNKQKLMLSRCLSPMFNFCIITCPTRGLDHRSIQAIKDKILVFTQNNGIVLILTDDLLDFATFCGAKKITLIQ